MSIVFALAGALVLVFAGLLAYSSVRVVEEGDVVALLVFGEMQAVLEPGLNIVPPFVSKTYPIDPRTTLMETGEDRVAVPSEFEDEVREASSR